MININNKDYKLCLFDTNALSYLLKNPKEWIEYFNNKFSLSKTIICYSVFTLSELYQTKSLFEKYIEIFSIIPSCILDGFQSIFEKELLNYKTNQTINPIVICPSVINEPNVTPQEKLRYVLKNSEFYKKTDMWINSRNEILNSITNMKENYPPKGSKYSINEINQFVFIVSSQQIMIRNIDFAKSELKNSKELNINKFPSIIATCYVTFYKFYPDNRVPVSSDIMDIIISSLLPYVDIIITENNLSHIIDILKKKHKFITHIENICMRIINNEISTMHNTT